MPAAICSPFCLALTAAQITTVPCPVALERSERAPNVLLYSALLETPIISPILSPFQLVCLQSLGDCDCSLQVGTLRLFPVRWFDNAGDAVLPDDPLS
jgi:hypothetical protein